MAKRVEVLTLSTLVGMASPNGLYLLAYSWLFGMCKSALSLRHET